MGMHRLCPEGVAVKRAWWCLSVLAFPLFALAFVVSLPRLLLNEWPRRLAKQAARPFLYCVKRTQGWRKVGALWVKGERVNRRKAVRP
jgi:hypothetical protein